MIKAIKTFPILIDRKIVFIRDFSSKNTINIDVKSNGIDSDDAVIEFDQSIDGVNWTYNSDGDIIVPQGDGEASIELTGQTSKYYRLRIIRNGVTTGSVTYTITGT